MVHGIDDSIHSKMHLKIFSAFDSTNDEIICGKNTKEMNDIKKLGALAFATIIPKKNDTADLNGKCNGSAKVNKRNEKKIRFTLSHHTNNHWI